MRIYNNQYTSNSNVNFGVRVALHRRFYTNPNKSPKTLEKIINAVEEQTKDIPGTLNLRDYFHSCHDTDPYARHTGAYFEHDKFKDMVVLYDSERLNLFDCKNEKLIKILVNLAKIFQSREKSLEEISSLKNMIENLQNEIKNKTETLESTLQEHYRNMGFPKSYNLAEFGGESNDRSYLFLGCVSLDRVSGTCKKNMVEQEQYLKQIHKR